MEVLTCYLTKMSKVAQSLIIVLSLIVIILIGVVAYILFFKQNVVDYESCVKAGNPVQESYPAVCKASNGKSYIQDIKKEETKTTNVTVYLFDRNKYDEVNQTDYFTPVVRTTTRSDVAKFAVEEIIKGPSTSDSSILGKTFGENSFIWFTSQTSNCGGNDFIISIAEKIATVQFCKPTAMAGDLSGSIVTDQITKTLKQFNTIEKVRVLNIAGDCLNDMSGLPSAQCVY